ncbi:TlpA family protein disulfide reductase [Phytoactinopolyspora halotolerans]|uniref:TlpA family protein disulfide reductase n=1 Tax=Phytoactinopolyspora halotolerans TaxID=1981512 RepID=A0A6L9SA82_9ACTN|nr:TlpA disulfide reductase family protein [Phytoactinopolyspora halotolerans]NEE02017.1 TlpA family protein disulfide reductase [Phytoactinopolyspora halotolerans]
MTAGGWRTFIPVAVLVAVLAVAGYVVAAVNEPTNAASGETAPTLRGEGLDGEPLDLTEVTADVVLVNFWASWCPPCEQEVDVLLEAERRYPDDQLAVLGVNSQDERGNAQRAAEEWGADGYRNVFDGDGHIAVDWGVVGLPETFVVDADGKVLARHKGPVTREWLNETLDGLVSS